MYTTTDSRAGIKPRKERNAFLWVYFGKERVLVCCPYEEAKREGVRAMWKREKIWVTERDVTGMFVSVVGEIDYGTLNDAARKQG